METIIILLIIIVFFGICAIPFEKLVLFKIEPWCPNIYLGYRCKMEDGEFCDHGSRAWAMLGVDLDELYEQPYIWQKEAKEGYFSEQ